MSCFLKDRSPAYEMHMYICREILIYTIIAKFFFQFFLIVIHCLCFLRIWNHKASNYFVISNIVNVYLRFSDFPEVVLK